MPFGGESFPDTAVLDQAMRRVRESPMPFGGESFPDKYDWVVVDECQDSHQCLSAGSPFRTYLPRHAARTRLPVTNAFRRGVLSGLVMWII